MVLVLRCSPTRRTSTRAIPVGNPINPPAPVDLLRLHRLPSLTMLSTSAESATRTRWWFTAAVVGAGYGVFLTVAALRLPAGAELTGQFWAQPAVKAAEAVLLAMAALAPSDRPRTPLAGRRAAVLGGGDFLLAIPWWEPSFVCGLGAFLFAHCASWARWSRWPAPTRPRVAVALVVVVGVRRPAGVVLAAAGPPTG